MLGKKFNVKKLARKVSAMGRNKPDPSDYQFLARECDANRLASAVPAGFLPVYVGEERERFVVPTSYLSHPLFKMLLEKAHDEFGYEQRNGLVVPCSAAAFGEVVAAVEGGRGKFALENFVEEYF
ncbi:hypothetical protein NMG60_11001472 [Bertholletia excelsa]